MTIRVVHELKLHVSQDQAQKNSLFERHEDLSKVTIDSFLRHNSGNPTVLNATAKVLSLGDVGAVKGVYIEADADCDVRLNGSADPIQLRRAPVGGTQTVITPTVKLFLESDITAIEVTASQGSDVNLSYVVWGDVAPPSP